MLPLEVIDQMLSAWDERLRRVDENLLALDSDPAYQMVSGPTGRDRYDGGSRQQISEALEELSSLFSDLEKLREVIEQARGVRASLKGLLWGKDEKIAQIEGLLMGPSITRGVEQKPIERRSLLDEGSRARAIAPEALLAEMVSRYETSRDALLSVWRAWQSVEPAVQRVEAQLKALDEAAARLGLAAAHLDGLVALRADVARIRTQTARDPLAARPDFEARLAPRFQIIQNAVAGLALRHQRAAADIAAASAELAGLRALQQGAAARWAQVQGAIEVGPAASSLLPPATDLDALEGALTPLQAPGGWQHLAALDGWQKKARALRERLARADQRTRALLGAGDELAGRLSARRAQASSLLARGAPVSPDLLRCMEEADALLRQRPRAVGRAAARLGLIDRALSGGSG